MGSHDAKNSRSADRRAREERIKLRVHSDFWSGGMDDVAARLNWSEKDYGRMIGILARTHKTCSEWCCGNERRWFGTLPRQWIRADLEANEQMKEWAWQTNQQA